MTIDIINILESLPPQLRYPIIEDISHRVEQQSVLARKQRKVVEILEAEAKKRQGARIDLLRDETYTSNGVQVSRRANTTEKVGKLYDEGEATVRKRIYVLEATESNPEKWGRFLNEMDADGYPNRAYQRLREAQRAESINRDHTPDLGQPIVRRGEVWRLGDHRLICGDSTVAADVGRILAGAAPHGHGSPLRR
jgi:hypothetical protein